MLQGLNQDKSLLHTSHPARVWLEWFIVRLYYQGKYLPLCCDSCLFLLVALRRVLGGGKVNRGLEQTTMLNFFMQFVINLNLFMWGEYFCGVDIFVGCISENIWLKYSSDERSRAKSILCHHLMGSKVGWLLRVGLLVSSTWYIFSYYFYMVLQLLKTKERYYDALYIKVKHMELHLYQHENDHGLNFFPSQGRTVSCGLQGYKFQVLVKRGPGF